MTRNLVITMPVLATDQLHYDFTKEALESIKTIHPFEIVLVNNNEKETEYSRMVETLSKHVIKNPKGNCVSAGWNVGVHYAFEQLNADYVIVSNNDVLYQSKCIDNLVTFADTHPEFVMWTSTPHNNLRGRETLELQDTFVETPCFSCFMLSKNSIEMLRKAEEGTAEPIPGYFDENFEVAYFEDQDYHQRILRAGLIAVMTHSSLFYHYGSRTIAVDEELRFHNSQNYEHNRKYFEKKWGYDSHGKAPTNQDRLTWGFKTAFNK